MRCLFGRPHAEPWALPRRRELVPGRDGAGELSIARPARVGLCPHGGHRSLNSHHEQSALGWGSKSRSASMQSINSMVRARTSSSCSGVRVETRTWSRSR
jgi:hypothetical protein